jgi:hypothetical protein
MDEGNIDSDPPCDKRTLFRSLLCVSKLNLVPFNSLMHQANIEFLCGMFCKLTSTRLGIATNVISIFYSLLLDKIEFVICTLFCGAFDKISKHTKKIHNFMTQFLVPKFLKILYILITLHHIYMWQRIFEFQ